MFDVKKSKQPPKLVIREATLYELNSYEQSKSIKNKDTLCEKHVGLIRKDSQYVQFAVSSRTDLFGVCSCKGSVDSIEDKPIFIRCELDNNE